MQPDPTLMPPPIEKKTNVAPWILIGVVCVCGFGAIVLAAILFPVFSSAKLAAKQAVTMSRLKQVGAALMTYQADFDDKFPPKMDNLSLAWPGLQKYAKIAFPESENPGHPEFEGNGKLAGLAVTKLDEPQKTYTFFDSVPWERSRSRVVLYADGHAHKVQETIFQNGILNGMKDK